MSTKACWIGSSSPVARVERLDGRHLVATRLTGEHDVGRDEPAVEQHGRCAGLAGSRPEADAEQPQAAEHGEQRVAGFARQAIPITVDSQIQFELDGLFGESRSTQSSVFGEFAHRETSSMARAVSIRARARRYSLEPRKSPIGSPPTAVELTRTGVAATPVKATQRHPSS